MTKSALLFKKSLNYFLIVSAVLSVLSLSLAAQNKKSNPSKEKKSKESVSRNSKSDVIVEIGKTNITFQELEKSYKKNFNRKNLSLKDLSTDSLYDFINLYAKYKLKVIDAESRGLDKDSAVVADIKNYWKIVAESYYFDKYLIEPKAEEMFKKRNSEMKIGIILCAVSAGPDRDTLPAYNKAKLVLDLLNNGGDFADIAKQYSDDKYSSADGGELPAFVTAGRLNREIEDIAYSLKPGAYYPNVISIPKFGYFLVKNIRTEPRFKVKFSHILISKHAVSTGTDSLSKISDSLHLISRADSVYNMLMQGADFRSIAAEYSDDPASNQKGGTFEEWYSRSTGFDKSGGSLVPEFETVLFKLKDGELSKVVPTMYGLHIIRRDSTKDIDLIAEKEDVKKAYKRLYYEEDKRIMLNNLRDKFGFELNKNSFNKLMSSLDTTVTNLDSNWTFRISADLKSQKLYSYNDEICTVNDFINESKKPGEIRGLPLNPEGINRAINVLTDNTTLKLATANLENEYPDFSDLMKEFRDGILLFKVEAIEVWDKLKFDSTFAKSYYDSTKTKYNTLPILNISEIYIINKNEADEIYNKINTKQIEFDAAAQQYTQRAGFREMKGNWNKLTPSKHKLAKMAEELNMKPGEISTPQKFEDGYSIIKLINIEPSRQKTFEEAISDFAPAMQDIVQKKLTEQWLERVMKKHPLIIKKDKIKALLNK